MVFLHRTVVDFLRDNSATLSIEKHAPSHFSDEGFLIELLKLRCIYRLRDGSMDCVFSSDLLEMIWRFLKETNTLEMHQTWLFAYAEITLENFRARCDCLGIYHLDTGTCSLAAWCAISGLHGHLLQIAQDLPHHVILKREFGADFLDLALDELENICTRNVTVARLICQALEYGCDPNASFTPSDQMSFCRRTKWETWLRSEFLRSQKYSQATERETTANTNMGASPDTTCQQFPKNSSMIELFLRHGADPRCMPCITDHQQVLSNGIARHATFHRADRIPDPTSKPPDRLF